MSSNERKRPSRAQYERAAELRRALRTFLRQTEQVSRAHGLTPERYELLLEIKVESNQDRGTTVTELCQALQLGQSAATQLVRRAENLGLVRRELSPHDARLRYLHLTPEGEQRLAGAIVDLRAEREDLAAVLGQLRRGRRSQHRRAVSPKPARPPRQ